MFSLENPHLGQLQESNQLRKRYQIDLSDTGDDQHLVAGEHADHDQKTPQERIAAAVVRQLN